MSSDIWTLCGGKRFKRSREIKVFRVVQSQATNPLLNLVDNSGELEILENLLEKSKPPLPKDDKSEEKLIYTPFRYFPRDTGSRFSSSTSPRTWYGATELKTCLLEKSYHQYCFRLDSEAIQNQIQQIMLTSFVSRWNSNAFVNLCSSSFKACHSKITSPNSYFDSQHIGEGMRQDKVEMFLFPSARHKGGKNFGSFSPKIFVKNSIKSREHWTAVFRPKSVTIIPHYSKRQGPSFDIKFTDFFVRGKFPRI